MERKPTGGARTRFADKYEGAFKEAIKARSDALAWMSSPLGSFNQKQTVELPKKYRLPAIYTRRAVVENGGLMSYGPDGMNPSGEALFLSIRS